MRFRPTRSPGKGRPAPLAGKRVLNSLKFTMPTRGKFVVLEGIDGSGKHTQMELLGRSLAERAIAYARVGFPNYDGFFGKLVAQFLNGDFGPLDAVDPH